jgi:hypothetical protein
MKNKRIILLSILLVLASCSYDSYETLEQRQNKKSHYAQPWVVHRIAKDFVLLDVWELPFLADSRKNQDFQFFLKLLQEPPENDKKNDTPTQLIVSDFLMNLRIFLGRLFSLDKNINVLPIPGCKETSLKERLTEEEVKKNQAEPEAVRDYEGMGFFRTVYLYENEWLSELSNNTVHALIHLGWIHKSGNFYTAQLAVFTKTRGWMGELYMRLIMPFRHLIIYPSMMQNIKERWKELNQNNAPQVSSGSM